MTNWALLFIFNVVIFIFGLPMTNESAIVSCILTNLCILWGAVVSPQILKRCDNSYVPVVNLVNVIFSVVEIIAGLLFILIKPTDIRILIITQTLILLVFCCILFYSIKACKNVG